MFKNSQNPRQGSPLRERWEELAHEFSRMMNVYNLQIKRCLVCFDVKKCYNTSIINQGKEGYYGFRKQE